MATILIVDGRPTKKVQDVKIFQDKIYQTLPKTDKVFARYNQPSLETLRAVVEGAPSTSVGKLLATGPETATVLSA